MNAIKDSRDTTSVTWIDNIHDLYYVNYATEKLSLPFRLTGMHDIIHFK